jgi:selenocysteine lyase/cysteine desulfurase
MKAETTTLESFFAPFRKNIIGDHQCFVSSFGPKEIVYADWTATGRAYAPIEEHIQKEILPFVGNTHTETTVTGTLMSKAYEKAKEIIKEHVGATREDILIFCGSGMTAAVNKLQRILGWRMPKGMEDVQINEALRPVVFVTHMEHHSNQISWLETIATVEIIDAGEDGNVDLDHFRRLLEKYRHRQTLVAAVTACSNVTGIQTPYHAIAEIIHAYGGWCFVDFASSAPYVDIQMHPEGEAGHLDAIYFSSHKFLGGPGTPGVLIFHQKLYNNAVPDQPGGGTIIYSNPWKEHAYVDAIEQREDGGTPPFLGAIKTALCVRLKDQMGVGNMLLREQDILEVIFERFSHLDNVHVLEGAARERLGVISFIVEGTPHNLVVQILNDRFGIQMRGGCSCAGTYGHHLLRVDETRSHAIRRAIRAGDLSQKPGWVRLSIHPTMSDAQVDYIMDAIELTAYHALEWMKDYVHDPHTDVYTYRGSESTEQSRVDQWFDV